MKKLLILLLASVFSFGLFAQDASELKNAGNDALRAKNYKEALTNFEAYFKVMEGNDKATTFNAAYCANRLKMYDKAVVYYSKSIKSRYKESSSYYYKAKAYKKLKKTNEMLATIDAGLKAKPGSKKLEKLLYQYFMKKGIAAQKAGKLAKATTNFEKVTTLKNKKFRTDALYSLGVLYSNEGSTILKKARPYANKEKKRYATEKSRASKLYVKALGYLDEAASINPSRLDVKKTKAEILKTMK